MRVNERNICYGNTGSGVLCLIPAHNPDACDFPQ